MAARSIGELVAPIIARAETMAGLQALLRRCPSAAHRKGMIVDAYEQGAIDRDEATLLIQAHQLETA